MWLNRFRIYAAEKRIAVAANFAYLNSVPMKYLAKQAAACAVHRIDEKTKLRRTQAVPIHQSPERFKIGGSYIKRMDQVVTRGKCGNAVAQDRSEFRFYLSNDCRRCRTSIARLVLNSIPAIRIVTRGDLNSAGGASQPYEERSRGRGTRLGRKPHGRTRSSNDFSGYAGESLRPHTGI